MSLCNNCGCKWVRIFNNFFFSKLFNDCCDHLLFIYLVRWLCCKTTNMQTYVFCLPLVDDHKVHVPWLGAWFTLYGIIIHFGIKNFPTHFISLYLKIVAYVIGWRLKHGKEQFAVLKMLIMSCNILNSAPISQFSTEFGN